MMKVKKDRPTYQKWLDGVITIDAFFALFSKGKEDFKSNKEYIKAKIKYQKSQDENPEFLKVQAKQEEIFDKRVNAFTNGLKREFDMRYKESMNKPRLLRIEIESVEKLLLPERLEIEKNLSDDDWINLGN